MAKDPTPHEQAITLLRDAWTAAQARMPGTPSIALDLEKVTVFDGEDGQLRAVIPMQEVIFLADTVLRSNKESSR